MKAWIAGVLVAVGGVAQAQGLVEQATDWTWTESDRPQGSQLIRGLPSPSERSYGQSLAASLQTSTRGAQRIGHFFHPGNDANKRLVARGVRVRLNDDDGTEIERFFLDSEQDAFEYALYGAEFGSGQDVIVEARGRQVVVIRGQRLEDPQRAARILDAAWGGLPAPKSLPSVSATRIDGSGMALVTRRPDPIFDREFQQSFDETRERIETGVEGFERLAPGDHYAFRLNNGWNGELHEDNGVRTLVTANSDTQREHLGEQLARAKGSEPPADSTPRKPLRGVAGVLGEALEVWFRIR